MNRDTWLYVAIIAALWFFVDSVDYWLTRPDVHTVPQMARRVVL